jgi:hypothetical protein
MIPAAVKRQRAMNRTLARFANKSFSWPEGRTCVHLLRWHLKHMGRKVPAVPKFASAAAARKALKERGWADVPAMLDELLERIPPAMMVLGDIAVVPGEGLDAILICAGARRVFGWHEEGGERPVMIEPDMDQIIGAWRV